MDETMQTEWEWWQEICTELRTLGIEINTNNRLTAAIRFWGEHLSELRGNQTPEVREAAFMDAASFADRAGFEVWT